jgi:hypothetical protein
LDISYNNFTGKAVANEIAAVFDTNRSLEYIGLAKNNLEAQDVRPLLKGFGRQPFPSDQVATH